MAEGAPAAASTGRGPDSFPRLTILLPGLYAWTMTVLAPVTAPAAGWAPRAVAVLAFAGVVAGPILATRRPRFGRRIGVWGGLGACVVCWAMLGDVLAIDRIHRLNAFLGAVGWAVFAFGWGAMRRPGVPEDDPRVVRGQPLEPRQRLPAMSMVIVAAGIVGGLTPVALAWQIDRREHALLGHAVALLCAVALVMTSARLAVERPRTGTEASSRQRLRAVARPAAILVLAVLIGIAGWLLRF